MTIPSEAHLLAFGRIIHNFAMVETGIKITLSGMLNLGLTEALVSFEPYGAIDLKNVAKSIAKVSLKPEMAEKFCCIVGDWASLNGLRNTIAHGRWTSLGLPAGAIKPRGFSIREGKIKAIGMDDNETSYTAPELEEKAEALAKINQRLQRFLRETGLDAAIEAKIAEDSEDKSDSSGSETKQSAK